MNVNAPDTRNKSGPQQKLSNFNSLTQISLPKFNLHVLSKHT